MTASIRTTGLALAVTLVATMGAVAFAQNIAAKPDGSWITLKGVVASAADDFFVLDYGEGLVTVEMDDWDWYEEGKNIIEGDEVTVYGRVDDDLYETATIEASSVYVEDLNTYFYASAADEEELINYTVISTPVVVDVTMELTGTVTDVDGREFTLDTGRREVTVDTSTMPYNPMDDEGYQRIREGDLVKVSGDIDYDLFEGREIMADTIITLVKDKKSG